MEHVLADLNAEQREAVCLRDGPLLVLAGPGSGKTQVITRRVAYGVGTRAVSAERVLAVTFTNRAAQEMKQRIHSLVGESTPVRVGTFHWIGSAILRRHAHRIGYRRDFHLLAPGEARKLLGRAAEEFASHELLAERDLAAAVGARKNGMPTDTIAYRHRLSAETLDQLVQRYGEELRAANALDLDDLLVVSARLLREDTRTGDICRTAYDEILVDEYQDVNPVQHEMLTLLAPTSRLVVAVGDEDQAIYGWRAADVQAILRFGDAFAGARTVKLVDTYRSTKHILRAARSLVQYNSHRIEKILRTANPAGERPICFVAADEIEEAEWIVGEIAALAQRENRPWKDFAVLFRVNAQSRVLEDAFLRRGVPYQIYAGHRFYDLPEIRRAVAYLQLALDRGNAVAATFLLGEVRGIGPRRLETLRVSAEANKTSLCDLTAIESFALRLPPDVRAAVRTLEERIEKIHSCRTAALPELVTLVVDLVRDAIGGSAGDLESVGENLMELCSGAREHSSKRGTLRTFVDQIVLSREMAQNRSGVSCLSLHASKGLEFPVVFVAGLEEGLLPHRRSLDRWEDVEEERRLCYVGMTRAREHLRLSYAHARLVGGHSSMGHTSRFVGEMGSRNLTVRVSPSLAAKPRLISVKRGQRVIHSRWQAGTVIDVEGSGRNTIVTVAFEQSGRQRMQLCYAPLRLAAEGQSDVLAG